MSRPEFWDGSCYFCGPRVRDGSGMAPALVIERSREITSAGAIRADSPTRCVDWQGGRGTPK